MVFLMVDILLLIVPSRVDGKSWYYPSSMGYIAGSLKVAGYSYKVIDVKAEKVPHKEVIKTLMTSNALVVGMSGLTTEYRYVKEYASVLKENPNHPLIVIGGGISANTELIINNTSVDVVVQGEGDITICEIVKARKEGMPLDDIKGITIRKENKPFNTPPRPSITDLDTLPMPPYEDFPMHVYLRDDPEVDLRIPHPNLTMITSRGCPYRCGFCYRTIDDTGRVRSAESVVKEMKYLYNNYGVRGIVFNDELTVVKVKRMFELCDLIIASGMNIKWGCTGRINIMKEDMLKKMFEAGCVWITYGIESGSQKILKEMNKYSSPELALNAIRLTREVGIYPSGSFIYGYPGETIETVKETIEFINKSDLEVGGLFCATPYPGTPLWDYAKKKGLIIDDEEFIIKLDNAAKFVINLTEWDDKEFMRIKEWAEKEINKNYFFRHPEKYKRALKESSNKLLPVLRKEGIINTTKLGLKAIRRHVATMPLFSRSKT